MPASDSGFSSAPPGVNRHQHLWRRYGLAVLLIVAAHAILVTARGFIGPAVTSVFLSAVIIASLYGGRGPGLLATLLATLDLDYTFTAPYNSFALFFEDFLWLVVFLAVALLTSSLQGRRRLAEESLRAAHADLERRVGDRTVELFRSREQFALLVNGVADQAFFMLDRHGHVGSWNAGAERLLGYREDQIAGCPVSLLWPQPGLHDVLGARGVATLADSRYEDRNWVTRKDGTRFWAVIVLTPVRDEAGVPRGYAISVRDMTERRSLERDILDISEREQQRIGHDLHDGLGQELTGIAMLGTALAEQLSSSGTPGADDAEQVADLIHAAIKHTRDLAHGLCPVDLEAEGLPEALRQLCDRVGRLPGMQCTFQSTATMQVDAATAAHLYRIAQEAINNAIRHGRAKQIAIELNESQDRLLLFVTDDGVGFPVNHKTTGMGLRLMDYRAKMIGGSVQIRPGAAGGTVVECGVDGVRQVSHG
jgi:PAS domain S-box-containing protein